MSQIKKRRKVKNQRSDFTLGIQANSSVLKCRRDEHHTLTYDPTTTCLKNQRNVSMMEKHLMSVFPTTFVTSPWSSQFSLWSILITKCEPQL